MFSNHTLKTIAENKVEDRTIFYIGEGMGCIREGKAYSYTDVLANQMSTVIGIDGIIIYAITNEPVPTDTPITEVQSPFWTLGRRGYRTAGVFNIAYLVVYNLVYGD